MLYLLGVGWLINKCDMPVFKSTSEILNNPWKDVSVEYKHVTGNEPPTNHEWNYQNDVTVDDIKVWEQLYFQPGNIGVYAAHSPRIEFYMIVYNLFLNTPNGMQTFYGAGAEKKMIEQLNKLKITLETNTVWVEPQDEWLYTD